VAGLAAAAIAAGVVGSWRSGGLVRVLVETPPAGRTTIEALRAYLETYGAAAPIVYVLAVTIEVLAAPIPGTLLYAPAGAIFGGLVGGTLSLAGNVAGASIAAAAARWAGAPWMARAAPGARLTELRNRLQGRGGWLVFFLRLNPLTSSDLVSYAAGLAGVPVRQVALGTLAGMIPQCYAQAYVADALFAWLPSGPWFVAASVAGAALVAWFAVSRSASSSGSSRSSTSGPPRD
jgi:uncharacterized membrane protein YdjX (TVP38/TMEM64 family)